MTFEINIFEDKFHHYMNQLDRNSIQPFHIRNLIENAIAEAQTPKNAYTSNQQMMAREDIALQKEAAMREMEKQQYQIEQEMKQKLAYMNTHLEPKPIILTEEEYEQFKLIQQTVRYNKSMEILK